MSFPRPSDPASDDVRIYVVHGIALLGIVMTVGAILAGAIVCAVSNEYTTVDYFADLKVYLLAFGAILLALGQFTGRVTHRRATDGVDIGDRPST